MSEVFFTSDLHIGHRLVAAHRGFGDDDMGAYGHDAHLADNWDSTVQPDDHIWVLGDISAGGKQAQLNALAWIDERPGYKHLIAGNHDGVHPMHRDSHKWLPAYLDVFESVQAFARRRINGQQVLLSHFPYGPVEVMPNWEPDEWRELADYPGYAAHPDGHIRGRFGRILKPYVMPNGYHQVTISGVGHRYVHRLVAEAFHGKPSASGMQVAHNNGYRWDNRAVNLRWVRAAENASDKYRHGTARGGRLRGGENPNAKLTADDVTEIRSSTDSAAAIAERFGITKSHVSAIRTGRSWRKDWYGDHTPEPRFDQYRLRDFGVLLLHGHIHRPVRKYYHQIHVGLDAWDLAPVHLDQVAILIGDKK